MKKRILDYVKRIELLLKEEPPDADWQEVQKEHLQQISFFQHERLIHLIVTVTFAFLLLMTIILMFIVNEIGILIFVLLAIETIVLVFYIFHYYVLENNVQKLYQQYDEITLKKGKQQ